MKYYTRILTIIFIVYFNTSCAQQLVKVSTDSKKLETDEKRFIGKPLKLLLDQIKPPIRMVEGEIVNRFSEKNAWIMFYFVDIDEYKKSSPGKRPMSIRVIFARDSLYQVISRPYKPVANTTIYARPWVKEDEKGFGNIVVQKIYVYGDY